MNKKHKFKYNQIFYNNELLYKIVKVIVKTEPAIEKISKKSAILRNKNN